MSERGERVRVLISLDLVDTREPGRKKMADERVEAVLEHEGIKRVFSYVDLELLSYRVYLDGVEEER